MRLPAISVAAAALVVLLVAPCTAHAATPKACDLFSAQTAASLVGGPVNAPVDLQGIGCSYVTRTGTATTTLTMADAQGMSGDDFMRMGQVSGNQPGSTAESIPGLGEHNFFLVRTSGQNGLTVLYHGKKLTLAVQRKMTPELKTQMIQVMKQILAKI
jgi:hypothetical protein